MKSVDYPSNEMLHSNEKGGSSWLDQDCPCFDCLEGAQKAQNAGSFSFSAVAVHTGCVHVSKLLNDTLKMGAFW